MIDFVSLNANLNEQNSECSVNIQHNTSFDRNFPTTKKHLKSSIMELNYQKSKRLNANKLIIIKCIALKNHKLPKK